MVYEFLKLIKEKSSRARISGLVTDERYLGLLFSKEEMERGASQEFDLKPRKMENLLLEGNVIPMFSMQRQHPG